MSEQFARIMGAMVLAVAGWHATVAAEQWPAATPGVEVMIQGAGDMAAAGRVLIGELGCINCHAPNDGHNAWLMPKVAPGLEKVGERITPQYLRDYLSDPHKTKPGTTMPDPMHGVPGDQRGRIVESLTHFLASQAGPLNTDGSTFTMAQVDRGEKLFHTLGCVACHEPRADAAKFEVVQSEQSEEYEEVEGDANEQSAKHGVSIPLPDLARKTTHQQLTAFLLDPLEHRPSGRMPSLNLSLGESMSIAAYLIREQLEDAEKAGRISSKPGLARKYYEGRRNAQDLQLDQEKPKRIDSTPTFSIEGADRGSNFSFRFEGHIKIPVDGKYTFFTRSDDASFLWIDNERIVNNGGTHPVVEKNGTVELAAGLHEIVVEFYQEGGGRELQVLWQGPSINRQEIPGEFLFRRAVDVRPIGSTNFKVNAEKAKAGAKQFASLGCVNCHGEVGGVKSQTVAGPALVDVNSSKGCLSSNVPAASPKFSLSDTQRRAITAALKDQSAWSKLPSSTQRVVHRMAALNCYACHERDDIGGPTDGRDAYFMMSVEADMGDEGRLPPALDGVGGKLTESWLKNVLQEGTKIRPYMATRMPKFGVDNVHGLIESFPAADVVKNVKKMPDFEKAFVDVGHKFVGTDGMGCVNCHTFAGQKSLGIPGPDLALMSKRLRYDWFARWMEDPATIRTGTRMPTYWPDRVSAYPDALDGVMDKQIAALWQYLSLGASARTPAGINLSGEALEMVVNDRPIVFRTFFQGAGPRAITVGYPDRVNIAMDPALGQITRMWKGRFVSGQPSWVGRAGGMASPLGTDVISFEGVPFARLENKDDLWPKPPGNVRGDDEFQNIRMLGYYLNEDGYPRFVFSHGFEDSRIRITEQPLTELRREGPVLVRKFSSMLGAVKGTGHAPWFRRVAVGKIIEKREDGSFVVDNKINIRIEAEFKDPPRIRTADGRKELILKISEQESKWTEVISW